MVGVVQGLVQGFSQALGQHQKQQSQLRDRETDLQMSVLNTLVGSDRPEVQRAAIAAMSELATKPGKASKGIQGFLGAQESSNAVQPVIDLIQRMESGGAGGGGGGAPGGGGGQPSAALPSTSLVEPKGQQALFETPALRDERRASLASRQAAQTDEADYTRRLDRARAHGLSPEQTQEFLFGLRPPPSIKPQAGRETVIEDAQGAKWRVLMDPTTGEIIGDVLGRADEKEPPEGRVVTTAEGVFLIDPTSGAQIRRLGDPRPITPVDTASFRNAKAALAAIRARAEEAGGIMYASGVDLEANRALQRQIAQSMGFDLDQLEQAATQRVDPQGGITSPPAPDTPPPPGDDDALARIDAILLKQDRGEPLTEDDLNTLNEEIAKQSQAMEAAGAQAQRSQEFSRHEESLKEGGRPTERRPTTMVPPPPLPPELRNLGDRFLSGAVDILESDREKDEARKTRRDERKRRRRKTLTGK